MHHSSAVVLCSAAPLDSGVGANSYFKCIWRSIFEVFATCHDHALMVRGHVCALSGALPRRTSKQIQ